MALQLDVRNSYLHFLNSFIYHLQAKYGDSQKYEMAIEGYQLALRLDPSNWIAQEFLGLTLLDIKQFDRAKEEFPGVLLISPESAVSIYGLMVASYMTGDTVMACTMADQFDKSSHEPNLAFLQTSVSVYASCGNFEKAEQMRAELVKLSGNTASIANMEQRLAQWKLLYRMWAQSGQMEDGHSVPDVGPLDLNNASASVEIPVSADEEGPRMVLVDVIMIGTEELINTNKGINLLSTLSLQLGSFSEPAFSKTFSKMAGSDSVTTISRAVTVPALTYSLNIANTNSATGSVLARPTLAAIEGMPSEFFRG